MTAYPLIRIAILCSSLILAACSTTNERQDFTQLAEQELTDANRVLADWSALDNVAPSNFLNELIDDPGLDLLITQALSANPSLQQTLLTLKASEWEVVSVQGRAKTQR